MCLMSVPGYGTLLCTICPLSRATAPEPRSRILKRSALGNKSRKSARSEAAGAMEVGGIDLEIRTISCSCSGIRLTWTAKTEGQSSPQRPKNRPSAYELGVSSAFCQDRVAEA